MSTKKQIVVVLRGKAAIRLLHNAQLCVNAASSLGPVNIICTTRYRTMSTGAVMPGDLYLEVRGLANSLSEALEPFANSALTLLPLFTLSANAAIAEAEIEHGYDCTPGRNERDYFQTYIPPESDVVHVGRNLNLGATVALMGALDKHSDSERLARGANQYREALLSWRLGRESLCLAHLWMAVEAITKVRLRVEISKQTVANEAELAKKMGLTRNSWMESYGET